MTVNNINPSLQKVLIVGGGISGLTLANALKHQGIPFVVYERDESPQSRTQGWSLSLYLALKHLKRCFPPERFENFGRETCVNHEDNEGNVVYKLYDGKEGRAFGIIQRRPYEAYRVSRSRFRHWLLQDIEENVHWNKRVSHYEQDDQGQVTVYFTDGTQDTGDLLVASDGAQSSVACQLYGGALPFKEATHISHARGFGATYWISEEDWKSISTSNSQSAVIIGTVTEEADKRVAGKTVRMIYTLNKIDRSRPETPYELLWFLSIFLEQDDLVPFPDGSNDEEVFNMVQTWSASAFSGSPSHQKITAQTPKHTPIVGLTLRERIPRRDVLYSPGRHVVLMGDAAHPMTVFKGEGANHAIIDASNLAIEISHAFNNTKTLDEAISSYYDEMIPRGENAVTQSHIASEKVHSTKEQVVEMYKNMLGATIAST
ncbi:hypothetical protein G6F46_010539 [Rhizopus delemar]|uniref:FAD-binding domain-containing protein n=3 Tax=Rhizopus TaxID=4842 RepID=I1BYI7_RHIO9|nr:hypothetical protein RO3G_05972 [Rhizopus delemar RA 99-880]KAG1446300.1 hypothetical protein G6F55_011603 [Rhizopus delemar]KAG1537007.1 hypothetical protein G6F51_010628 [Rhizopus arrhizus]KAG1499171.1 hypothetical protein G6F54_004580 [Rhizopus delemar]KAG1504814.1 hypothetical protein G6F53_010314 [Rhizopus delemar]|eukprot:EIE81267.1 hypothetical protein RO3G_05972 [Rhizopus delemar RA 99-880]